jgi:hypothetical protein
MTAPPLNTLLTLLLLVSPAFTQPSFHRFLTLFAGWVRIRGLHAVTESLVVAGVSGTLHHAAFHRFFSRARWSLDEVGHLLLLKLVALAPGPLRLVLDDTLCTHKGPKVFGLGVHVDAVRSTRKRRLLTFGHVWVVLAVLVPVPFSGRVWALPVLFRLFRTRPEVSDDSSETTRRRIHFGEGVVHGAAHGGLPMRVLQLSAVTRGERHDATSRVEEAINRCGGWLVDFSLFSNVMTVLRFEAPVARLSELARALAKVDIPLDEPSQEALRAMTGEGEVLGTLQLTFIHGEPELRRAVPPIPAWAHAREERCEPRGDYQVRAGGGLGYSPRGPFTVRESPSEASLSRSRVQSPTRLSWALKPIAAARVSASIRPPTTLEQSCWALKFSVSRRANSAMFSGVAGRDSNSRFAS